MTGFPGTVEAFLGLMYASTRQGRLRFMPPKTSTDKWNGVKFTKKFGPVCNQPRPSHTELSAIYSRLVYLLGVRGIMYDVRVITTYVHCTCKEDYVCMTMYNVQYTYNI